MVHGLFYGLSLNRLLPAECTYDCMLFQPGGVTRLLTHMVRPCSPFICIPLDPFLRKQYGDETNEEDGQTTLEKLQECGKCARAESAATGYNLISANQT